MENLTLSPDLQTREAVMVAAGRCQLALTTDEGVTLYVKIEAKAKDLPGSSKRYTAVPLADATHVFISEKGYGTQRLGTYYPPRDTNKQTANRLGRFYEDIDPQSPHMEALRAIESYLRGDGLPQPFVSIEAESQCGLCGRELTDPVSIKRGIGPECAAKPTGTKILHASAFTPIKPDFTPPQPALPVTEDEAADAFVAMPPSLAAQDLNTQFDSLSDAALESIIALARRHLYKREFARHEAEQETAAFMAGI
jgi:hypothetical protein